MWDDSFKTAQTCSLHLLRELQSDFPMLSDMQQFITGRGMKMLSSLDSHAFKNYSQ